MLFTEQYLLINKAKLQGALRAAMQEININSIPNIDYKIAKTQVESLIKDKLILGKINKNNIFTPKIFDRDEHDKLTNSYKQNQYIEHEMIKNLT